MKEYLDQFNAISKLTSIPVSRIVNEAIGLWVEAHTIKNPKPNSHQVVRIPICESQLEVAPIGDEFAILLDQDHNKLIYKKTKSNLFQALQLLEQIGKESSINSNDWNEFDNNNKKVIILQKASTLPHIWMGQNSACKIFNNSSVTPQKFKLTTQKPTQNICKACIKNYQALRSPRVNLEFDHHNQPIF